MNLLIIVLMIPIIANVVISKFMGRDQEEFTEKLAFEGKQLVSIINANCSEKIDFRKTLSWAALPIKKNTIVFPEYLENEQNIRQLAEIVLISALAQLQRDDEKRLKKYYRQIRIMAILPLFTILLAVALKFAGKLHLNFKVMLTVALVGLSLAALQGAYKVMMEMHLIRAIILKLEKSRRLSSDHLDLLHRATRAYCFREMIPSFLRPLLGGALRADTKKL